MNSKKKTRLVKNFKNMKYRICEIFYLFGFLSLANGLCTYYTIQNGDTFNDLAKKYSIEASAIIAANPDANPYNLQIGQVICIPYSVTSTNAPGYYDGFKVGCLNYQVRNGDSCTSLASASSNNFYLLNPTINCNSLFVGQWVCVPLTSICGSRSYRVVSGDTCQTIAQKLDTSVEYIQRCNNNLNGNGLDANQLISY